MRSLVPVPPTGHADTLTPSRTRPWWAEAGHGYSEGGPPPDLGAFPPAPRSRLLTLLGPSTVHLFHGGSGGGESGAVRPGLAGGEVTSSFSISRAELTSLMERQSLGMEAGGDGGRAGRGPRQTQMHTRTRMHTCAHGHTCAHILTCMHTCTCPHMHTRADAHK